MKVIVPLFREGHEWRRLTREERAGKPWKYKLLVDVFIAVPTGVKRRYECRGACDTLWMVILPHGILMKSGYAWNGNTSSPDELLGVCLRIESLPHDGFFQFSGAIGFPRDVITLRWVNWLYLKMSPCWIGWAYYAGLVAGSWALWARPPKDGEYVESLPLQCPEPV